MRARDRSYRWLLCSMLTASCGGRLGEEPASQQRDSSVGPDSATSDPSGLFDVGVGGVIEETTPFMPSMDAGMDGPPIVFVNARADVPGVYFCFGGFPPTEDPTLREAPITALGPFGRPDEGAGPGDFERMQLLRYGEAAQHPTPSALEGALGALTLVAWMVPSNPLTEGSNCAKTWMTVRNERARFLLIEKGTVAPKRKVLFVATALPELRHYVLPGPSSDSLLQTINVSQGTPEIVDLYLHPRDAMTTLLAKATTYNTVSPAVAVPDSFAMADTRLIIAPKDVAPCETSDGSPSGTCGTWSPRLGAVTTQTFGSKSVRTLVWFGAPDVRGVLIGAD